MEQQAPMQNLVVQLIANGTMTLRSCVAELPFWAEEVALIFAIAMVYIIMHFSVTLIHKECRSGASHRKLLSEEPAPTSTRAGPWLLAQRFYGNNADSPTQRRVPLPPAQATAHTPKTYRELPGVTDRRFKGVVVSYKPEEGYGFIQCPELHDVFGRDVFLHRLQIGRFDVGASVSFGVFLNKNSQPQAKEVTDVGASPDSSGIVAHRIRRLPPKLLPQQQQQQQQPIQRCNDFADSPASAAAAAHMARYMQGRPTWEELMTSQPAPCDAAWLADGHPIGEPCSTVRRRTAGTEAAC